ncbi:SERTA domain-containing protein 3 [Marasmius crinis-equi]|uniref:SERTA domain-containing protein 3 n=1 Tax=Marasmius crinis-equi TaxID=585013 RepID=A0ABR3ETR7_9AGAR
MPSQRTFTGQRAEFLLSKAAEYARARLNGTAKDEVAVIQRQFFNRWPVDLPLNVELAPEVLAAVDDDKPADERPDPESMKDELSEKEYEEAVEKYRQYKVDLVKRKRQIEDRLKSDYDKANGGGRKIGDQQNPFTSLLLQLSEGKNSNRDKPRKNSAAQEWATENKKLIDDKLQEAKKAKKTERKGVPKAYNDVMRDEFKKLSKEKQQEWEEKSKETHAERLRQWKERMNSKPSEEPQARQACINNLGDFCKPILDGICERTGMAASIVVGGPEPQDGGRINVLAIHGGPLSGGDVPMDWGRSEVQVWKRKIFPSFARHLKKVFSMDECRARALPEGGDGDSEAGGEEEGDDVVRWREDDAEEKKESPKEEEKEKKKGKGGGRSKPGRNAAENEDDDVEPSEERDDGETGSPAPAAIPSRIASRDQHSSSFAIPSLPPSSPVPSAIRENAPLSPLPAHSPAPVASSPVPFSSPVPHHNSPPSSHHARSVTPSPTPARLVSPLPASVPSKRKASSTAASERKGKRSEEIKMDVENDRQGSRKRKAPAMDETVSQGDVGADKVSKKQRVEPSEEEDSFPELPEGVGNGRADFYASRALALFGLEAALQLDNWVALVWKWFRFEELAGFDGEGKKLGTAGRPAWVGEWVGRGRNPNYLPDRFDGIEVLGQWWGWWAGLQPTWRRFDDRKRPLASYAETGSWKVIRVAGSNGLTNIIAALVFIAVRLSEAPSSSNGRAKRDLENARKDLQLAVDDLSLVLDGVLGPE